MPCNGYSAPCVTSQPGPWDDDWTDYASDEATNEWEKLWEGEPKEADFHNKYTFRSCKREWLVGVALKIIAEYDGNLTDIEDHLSEFYEKWVEARAEAIVETARQDYEEAKADAYADRDDW